MIKKILLGLLLVVLLVVVGAAWFLSTLPAASPPSTVRVEITPARLERGRYLTEAVTPCFACHAKRDATRYGMPELTRAEGECWNPEVEFPGLVCAPNLTAGVEGGLADWTDGEILRAIREGVRHDGEGLFPIMPYTEFAALGDEDAMAIVAYLRSLDPIPGTVPARRIPFPVSLATKFAPQPLSGPVTAPDPSDSVAYGGYLAKVAGCEFCHTPVDENMAPIADMRFGGGHELILPGRVRVLSSNLTPHETGIGALGRDNFIGLFRSFTDVDAVAVEPPRGVNTFMPWFIYTGMTDEDLGAIYEYLRTVPPVENTVDTWPDRAVTAGG